ncbi:MAG: lactate utilization protein [Planctomycetota bacterium]|nr:MAG: lactate utilization protein [Planctomycetota bacterium]
MLEEVASALRRNNFVAHIAANRKEALQKALSLIPEGATVGLGGSVTNQEIGLLAALREGNWRLIDQYEEGIGAEESMSRRRKGVVADVFVCGTNAVTKQGWLVNVDGIGNRVAGLIFGGKKVVVVVGRNKVVEDLDAAWERIRRIAPRNAARVGAPTPCAKDGVCHDCNSPRRICNIYVVLRRSLTPDRVHVILVDEDLGY